MLRTKSTTMPGDNARPLNSTALLLFVLGAATVLTRLPFISHGIESFDAINYILALSHFDIRLHQPQPPGYPLYILTGRLFNLFVQHEHLALLLVSAVFSGFAVIVVYLLGRDMFGHKAGLLSAIILGTSSFFWFTGEIAAPYAMDLFFSALAAWLCYRALQTNRNGPVWIAALVLGLAGAFRVQTMVFLFPMFLFSIRKRPWHLLIGSSIFAVGVFAAFFVPAVMVSGGFQRFWVSMTGIVPIISSTDSFVHNNPLRYVYNIVIVLKYTFTIVGEFVWPFVTMGAWVLLQKPQRSRLEITLFSVLWLLPIWMVYFVIWPGNKGTVQVSIAPYFILAGAGLDWLIQQKGWRVPGYVIFAILIAWQSLSFAILPERPLGEKYRQIENWNTIQKAVNNYQTKLNLISQYPVDETVVYAVEFRHLQYELPQYHTFSIPVIYPYDPQQVKTINSIENGVITILNNVAAERLIPPGTRYVVFFDLPLAGADTSHVKVEIVEKDHSQIHVVEIPPGKTLRWVASSLIMEESPP